MGHGIRITNPSGQLVLSSYARGLYCLGKAALQGSVVQPSGSATAPSPGRTWGYSVYRIAHSGPIIPAIDWPLGKRVGINSVVEVSPGVWDITAYCGDTPDAYLFDTQHAVDVWAFGFKSTAPSGWGGVIRDADGAVAYDLTHPYPLFPRAYRLFPADGSDITIPALTRPVVMGCPTGMTIADERLGANQWAVWFRNFKFQRFSGGNAGQREVTRKRYELFSPTGSGIETNDAYECASFLIEGADLP